MMFAVFTGYYSLWQQLRTQPSVHSRFLTLTLPFLVLCLAIVVSFKRFAYIALILPFLMLQAGLGIAFIWHRLGQKRKLWQGVFFIALLLTFGEGIWGIVRTLHTAAGTMPYTTLVKTLQQDIPIGSRILMMHNYWLGMMDYDVYSIDLAYNLSDPDFTGTNARPLAQVIQQMEPNYIIVPQHLLKSYIGNSESLPNEKVYNLWRSLDMYIQQYCPVEVTHIETTAYGTITTYHCP
jgi:hypothetical protein